MPSKKICQKLRALDDGYTLLTHFPPDIMAIKGGVNTPWQLCQKIIVIMRSSGTKRHETDGIADTAIERMVVEFQSRYFPWRYSTHRH